jgi:hypothetical protein
MENSISVSNIAIVSTYFINKYLNILNHTTYYTYFN